MDTSKKLTMATKAALLPNFPQAFVRKLSKVLLLTSVGTVLIGSPGWSVVVAPTSITVSVPANGTNPAAVRGTTQTYSRTGTATVLTGSTAAYVDDVLLQSITFNNVIIGNTPTSRITPALARGANQGPGAEVTAGRSRISATYGDDDTAADGNPNPFVTSGSGTTAYTNPPNQTPAVQDTAIQAAYSSLSLSQGISSPGQGGTAGDYTFKLLFENGIVDNSSAGDQVPELVIFERGTAASGTAAGTQSDYTVQAIIGGTFVNPTFAPTTVTVLRANQTPSGIIINTVDSGVAEQINVAGIDLTEFGITDPNQAVYGISFTSINNSGADIFGLAQTAADTSQLRAQAVPEPLTIIGSGMALGFGALMKRQYSRKRKQTEQTG